MVCCTDAPFVLDLTGHATLVPSAMAFGPSLLSANLLDLRLILLYFVTQVSSWLAKCKQVVLFLRCIPTQRYRVLQNTTDFYSNPSDGGTCAVEFAGQSVFYRTARPEVLSLPRRTSVVADSIASHQYPSRAGK
jgi:hypothetical protein